MNKRGICTTKSADSFTSVIDGLINSSFEQTLYFGENCQVISDIHLLYKVLENFDLIVVQDFNIQSKNNSRGIPNSFPFFYCDVLGFSKNEQTQQFLKKWKELIESGMDKSSSLRQLCWTSEIRLYILAPEWNIKEEEYLALWSEQEAQPFIINTKKALEDYQFMKRPLHLTNRLRYNWRKCKSILWELRNL